MEKCDENDKYGSIRSTNFDSNFPHELGNIFSEREAHKQAKIFFL